MVRLGASAHRQPSEAAAVHTIKPQQFESWRAGATDVVRRPDQQGTGTASCPVPLADSTGKDVVDGANVSISVDRSRGRRSGGGSTRYRSDADFTMPALQQPKPHRVAVASARATGTAAAVGRSTGDAHHLADNVSFLDTVARDHLGLAVHEDVCVWPTAISTEVEQQRVIEATIKTADTMAAITTYSVRPMHENQLSRTLEAVCRGIAERQDDEDFTFFLLYNRQILAHTLAVGRRTEASLSKPTTWTRAFEAYNARVAAGEIPGKPIEKLACKVVLLEAKPQHIVGSWHNKFYINDRGFFATGGWSTANRSKPTWFDCGAVMLHRALCQQQWRFFGSHMLKKVHRHGSAARVVISRTGNRLGFGLESIDKDSVAGFRRRCADLHVSSPEQRAVGADSTAQRLSLLLRVSSDPMRGRVSIAQNKGCFYTPLSRRVGDRPATRLVSSLIGAAGPGDTLCCRDESLDSIVIPPFVDALCRGAKVRFLLPRNRLADARNYGVLRAIYDQARRRHVDGRLEFKVFGPSNDLMDLHGYRRTELGPPTDHAKVYCLERRSGPNVAVIGTLNLDRQSWFGSNEIVAAVERAATSEHPLPESRSAFDLARAAFHDFWDASGPVLRYDDAMLMQFSHQAAEQIVCSSVK